MITQLIAVAFLAILLIGLLFVGLCLAKKRFTHGIAVNIAEGTHANGVLNKRADAAHSYRHLLCKEGSDDSHIAVNGVADEPLGVCPDTPEAAESLAALYLLGVYPHTVKMVGSEAIDAGADVYTAAGGKVQDEPAVAGTYWLVGKAVSDCSGDLGEVEVAPCKPVKLIVLAAIGNANGEIGALTSSATTTQAEFNALRDKCEELADDFRALAGALAAPAMVKILSA